MDWLLYDIDLELERVKWHVNTITGIHIESMKNYSGSLNEMVGKVAPVNV